MIFNIKEFIIQLSFVLQMCLAIICEFKLFANFYLYENLIMPPLFKAFKKPSGVNKRSGFREAGHFGVIMGALLYEMGITLGGLIFSLMEFRKREV